MGALLTTACTPGEAAGIFAVALLSATKMIELTLNDQAKDELLVARNDADNANYDWLDFIVGKFMTIIPKYSENSI